VTGLDDQGSILGAGDLIFIFVSAASPVLRPTQPLIQWLTEALSLGVERPGRKAGTSPPSSADVSAWNCTSIPPYVFITYIRGEFKKFVDWRHCAAVMQEEA